jgi:hypothetical protein
MKCEKTSKKKNKNKILIMTRYMIFQVVIGRKLRKNKPNRKIEKANNCAYY